MANRVVIASTARTPFTRANKGELKDTRPDTMAAHVIKAALARVPGLTAEQVEDVVLGCAMPEAEQGMNVARIASLLAGLPDTVPAMTINRFCASGVQSIAQVAAGIQAGHYSIGVAGGTETMTLVPMGGNKVSANPELMEKYPEVYTTMGATAEKVAAKWNVARADQDAFALESQRRASTAREQGKFKDEIAPIAVKWFDDAGQEKTGTIADDTILRPETTLEGLQKLKPAFDSKGTVTAGNASPLTDGAAAAVVMSEAKAKELGVTPLGYFVDYTVAGVPPDIMGIGPVPAVRKLLERNKLTVKDIDLFELNEAFAAQVLQNIKAGQIPEDKVNVAGGAIAIGHPIGGSGARCLVTLIHQLHRTGGKRGVVALCLGGGNAVAMVVEV